MPESMPSVTTAAQVAILAELRAAALAAIPLYGKGHSPYADANPYTRRLHQHDLTGMFTRKPGSRDNLVRDLPSLATIIEETPGLPGAQESHRAARAGWVGWELDRLGEDALSEYFFRIGGI